jgi:acyl-CoA dehydrogenase
MHWAIWDAMFKAQNAFEGVISNFPNRFVAAVMSAATFPLGRPYVVPADRLGQRAARILIEPSPCRDRLTSPIHLSESEDDPLAQVERALAAVVAAEPAEAKLRLAMKSGRIDAKQQPGAGFDELAARAQAAGVITAEEADAMIAAHELTGKVIRVDDFAQDLGASEMRIASLDALASELGAIAPAPPASRMKQVARQWG